MFIYDKVKRVMRMPMRDWTVLSVIFILVAMIPSRGPAQPKTPDAAQVITNVQHRLQQAQGLSLEVEARFAGGDRIVARIEALRPNYLKV
jgi:hypothetical protein